MKIVSYNVNGIRAAIKKGLVDWVSDENPDVFCIQESKSQEEQIDPEVFSKLGYHAYWHSAEKKGYSGVVTYSKKQANQVIKGMGIERYDVEGRVIRTDFDDFILINVYFPSGSSGEERHVFKMQFLEDMQPWAESLLNESKNVIILGDYNIVRLDIDIHNPERKDNPSGFRPEERVWLNSWFENSFVDAFRYLYPDKENNFSWWSYRAGSRKKNKGWRIDYISVSETLKNGIQEVKHGYDVVHSDHAPVIMEIEL